MNAGRRKLVRAGRRKSGTVYEPNAATLVTTYVLSDARAEMGSYGHTDQLEIGSRLLFTKSKTNEASYEHCLVIHNHKNFTAYGNKRCYEYVQTNKGLSSNSA